MTSKQNHFWGRGAGVVEDCSSRIWCHSTGLMAPDVLKEQSLFNLAGSRSRGKALCLFETSKQLCGEVASCLRSEFLKCNLGSDIGYDFFYVSKSCYQMGWSSVQFSSVDYSVASCTSFQVFIWVFHVKSMRNTGQWYLITHQHVHTHIHIYIYIYIHTYSDTSANEDNLFQNHIR